MKKSSVCAIVLSLLWLLPTASAQRAMSQDPNERVPAGGSITDEMRRVFNAVLASRAEQLRDTIVIETTLFGPSDKPLVGNPTRPADALPGEQGGDLCAVLILPGPPTANFIRLGLFNVAQGDRLEVLIMDSFRALKGQSLLLKSVFDTMKPTLGTLTVVYPPDGVGKGPAVISFTEFSQFTSAAFTLDPSTYDNPLFEATVRDMDQTSIELVYSSILRGPGAQRRCQGTLRFDPTLNASIANIVQVYPRTPLTK